MCTLTKKSKRKSFTGYSYAVKIKGKYYSPATGCQWKEGMMMPCMKEKRSNTQRDFWYKWVDMLCKDNPFHNKHMQGRKSVFVGKADLLKEYNIMLRGVNTTILKITIAKDIMKGYVGEDKYPVFAGKQITKIVEL